MPVDEDLITYAVDAGLKAGSSYVEARYHYNYNTSVVMRKDKLLGFDTGLKEGIGVRVLINGSLGFAATNNITWEGIRKALNTAISRAKSVSSLRKAPIEFSIDRLGKASYSVITKEPLESLDIEKVLNLGTELWNTIQSSIEKVKIPVSTFSLSTSKEEKLIINSDGAHIRSIIPRINAALNVVLTDPNKGSIQRRLRFGGSGGAELIKEWKMIDAIINEIPKLEKVLLQGKEPPKELIDLVLGSEVIGLITHESAGHPMEADRILGREAAQAGESFVKPKMIGNRIGSDLVTIIENPGIPGSLGYYLFDDEGVPAKPRYLYKDGLINEPLHNRHTARVFGTQSNGAARAMDYNSEPIIRMSNTYFKPGDYNFEELIEDINLGVFMKSYMEWNIDDNRWNMRFVGLEAYIIRNGEIAEPVRNPVLEVTTKGFYTRVSAVGKELRFYPGRCGKGEPHQGVPVWEGGPDVKVSKIKLGVVA